MSALILIIIIGITSYITVPKEADPDIAIPWINVTVVHEGISPEDGERLLLRPLEQELRSLEGLKELKSTASENYAGLFLEFDASFDRDSAMADVREKVDLAKPDLPPGAEEPKVTEFNASLFPVIGIALYGEVPERTLLETAHIVENAVKDVPEVRSAEIVGEREEMLEVVIDPAKLEAYGISLGEVVQAASQNNRLIAAGAVQNDQSRFSVKVPGLFENAGDVAGLPIRSADDGVVTLGDVAEIRRTFKDVQTITRFNGQPSLAVWAVKRLGENAVDTTDHIRQAIAKIEDQIPDGVSLSYTNDMSTWVFTTQDELESAVSTAIVLVMIIVVAALGLRSGLLVGIAIPSSFMFGFLLIGMFGQTLNMMVMFGLVLSVGLLVDGAIVIVELADRKMAEGVHRKDAYGIAAKRMAWPIISSTATTLAAFLPLLAWPGVTGEFMGYLPRTLIFVLCGSLVVTMIFLPVLGSMFGRANAEGDATLKALAVAEGGDPLTLPGFTGRYARLLGTLVAHPTKVLLLTGVILYACVVAYGTYGRGVEYSADMEPQEALVIVGARGNFSPPEILRLVQEVENIVLRQPGVEAAFTELGSELGTRGQDVPRDTVATINMEFTDWKTRKDAREIIQDIRDQSKGLPGIYVEVMGREQGPRNGKEINIELTHPNFETLLAATGQLRDWMEGVDGLVDIEDTRPLPGIDWQLQVDREQAARFGVDITTVGAIVQLMTNGMMIGDYRPDDAQEEVDIRIRFPSTHRSIDSLDQLTVQTRDGPVPITNFVTRVAKPRVSEINRVDGERVTQVKANPAFGLLASDKLKVIEAWIDEGNLPEGTIVRYRGSNEDQQESTEFLGGALLVSLFLMGIILITQFNSFYHAFLILSAIVLSTVGALVGMLIRDQAFSVIMTGTGIIALAGIVVNNNIVLVDTFQHLVREGENPLTAIVRTGAQRLRPVMLTTVTTICGILPMAYHLSINFFSREIDIGSPVGMWWVQLATAIVYGLGFATVLTLLVTPCMIALPHVWRKMLAERRAAKGGKAASTPAE